MRSGGYFILVGTSDAVAYGVIPVSIKKLDERGLLEEKARQSRRSRSSVLNTPAQSRLTVSVVAAG
jgi:hypothetical protein